MNNIDKQYQELLQDILDNGIRKSNRTGVDTISVFGRQIRHKMSEGFPLLTTKKVAWKQIVSELLWFLRGETNIQSLVKDGNNIWVGDAYKNYCKNADEGAFSKKWLKLEESFDGFFTNQEYSLYTKEEFIERIKTDDDFAKEWVKITNTDLIDKAYMNWKLDGRDFWEKQVDGMFTSELGKEVVDNINKKWFVEKIKTDDDFAKRWGEMGPIYGKQWRSWDMFHYDKLLYNPMDTDIEGSIIQIDQIKNLINDLKTNPDSRRLMVNAWNVSEIDSMVLPPCHYGFQVYTRELSGEERWELLEKKVGKELFDSWVSDIVPFGGGLSEYLQSYNIPKRAISLMWNQRSVDTPLGLPFNIASYALLLEILARLVNMIPDELIGNLGDTHIYVNQIDGIKEQLTREPYELPTLRINSEFWPTKSGECGDIELTDNIDALINQFQKDDFQLENYKSHPKINFPLSN